MVKRHRRSVRPARTRISRSLENLEARQVLAGDAVSGPVVISEIMYHPASHLDSEEFIELVNVSAGPVQLVGWRLDSAIEFTFPSTVLPAGQRLVVVADQQAFAAKYPNVTSVAGIWNGHLHDGSERIELKDAAGKLMDVVQYADEGDWATRVVGPLDHGHRGWDWQADHDGGGKSLELVNPSLANHSGLNWSSSVSLNGTPGQVNSVNEANSAPLILDMSQSPILPRSTDAVIVSANISDELASLNSVRLHWRLDGAANFTDVPMFDDGQHGDGAANDGRYGASIPAQPNRTVVEYFVRATDAANQIRSYPGPVSPTNQMLANRLYQVDNTFDPAEAWQPGAQPVYRLVMKDAERAELAAIGRDENGAAESNAQMNGTLIIQSGTGLDVRYQVGIRNRGHGSRTDPPNNYRVHLPKDRPWNDVWDINFNARTIQTQLIGSAIYQLAGLVAADATAAEVRINGQDLALPASGMFGSYAHVEQLDSRGVERHFPLDSEGNLYSAFRLDDGSDEADLAYEGTNPAVYQNRYFKQTNQEQNDWSDLIALTEALNLAPEDSYVETVGQHVNIDQWLRYLALDALLLNRETGLNRGIGDDYQLYRGINDSRFVLVPHDLDTLMQQGNNTGSVDQSILTYREVDGLARFFSNPEIVSRYYRQVVDLIETTFKPEVINPLIDRILGSFVAPANLVAMKQFVEARSAAVLAQIPREFRIDNSLPVVNGLAHTTSPTLGLSGVADAAKTQSVMVDGQLAAFDHMTGKWQTSDGTSQNNSEPLITKGSVWRYLDDGSNQQSAWTATAFNDQGWKQGPAQLGYGDDDEATVVNSGPAPNRYITTYFRREFTVDDPSAFNSLVIDLLRDDGAVVYLNGTELLRSNLPAKPATINHLTLANSNISGDAEDAFNSFTFTAETSLLQAGKNVLAVEIHQRGADSADLGFDLSLTAVRSGTVSGGVPLQPGLQRIRVQAFDGPNGTGNVVNEAFTDVWFDGAAPQKVLLPETPQPSQLDLLTSASYRSGIPMLVRIEAIDANGQPLRELWDADVQLSVDSPRVNLSAYQLSLRNGVGSALVIPTGSGPFTLTARLGNTTISRTLADWNAQPETTVSGTLPGASTIWSGLVRVTGDVTVPASHTLTILPGTTILFEGNATPLSTDGADLIVNGSVQSAGTIDLPITFTATNPQAPWGQLFHQSAQPSLYRYTQITRAGHAPRGGHTNTGPAIRAVDSTIEFDHVDITDIAGKTMQADGANLTFRHSQFARSVMGPEVTDTGLIFEDGFIVDMLGKYREDGVTDDNDGIYIHRQGEGQTVRIARSVIAHTDDDGIDTLGPDMVMEDLIIRDLTNTNDDPKAITIINGNNTIRNVLMANVDIGISAKGQSGTTPRSNNVVENVTILANSIGIQAEDKFGIPGAIIDFDIRNAIVSAPDPIRTDYDPAKMVIRYSNLVGEAWTGVGNLNEDPLFVNAGQHAYSLQAGSSSVNAGDPASPPDADGSRADQGYYRNGHAGQFPATTTLNGTLNGNTILAPWQGAYRVTGNVTVPAGSSLRIMPGTTLFFENNATLQMNGGQLIAEGTEHETIRFTRAPGAQVWGGIQFTGSTADNRIRYAVLEYGGLANNQGMLGLTGSNVTVEHSTFDHADRRRIRSQNSSLIVRDSVFTDLFPGANQAPTTDNLSEHIWGGGIPDGGHFIIERNIFGRLKGHNDGIDFDAPRAPNPIPQILNNHFLGGGDDALDMTGDYYIEGNTFQNFHKDVYNLDPGQSNVLSASGGNYTVVRNTFIDVGHVTLVKENAFMDFQYNTVVHADLAAIYFDLPGQTSGPGRGAHVTASIFFDTPIMIAEQLPTTDLIVRDSIVPQNAILFGTGNTSEDPRLTNPLAGDVRLLPGSPALQSAPLGLDRGATANGWATISGEPADRTSSSSAALAVGGPGIVKYQFRLNSGAWSEVRNVTDPIVLTNLADGEYQVRVRGQNVAGVWQPEEEATRSKTWTVQRQGTILRISEVLASNAGAFTHQGTRPDAIELFNGSQQPVDLAGMRITSGGDRPREFVFPSVVIPAGGYLTLLADSANTPGVHLGFDLDEAGDSVFLYDASTPRQLIDRVDFGVQVANLSIARSGPGQEWMLSQPTLGAANQATRTGNPATLVINEWLASEKQLPSDFVELFNPDVLPVPLGGLQLSDTVGWASEPHEIAPLSFIAGTGHVAFTADGDPEKGASHLPFRLDRLHETLTLLDTNAAVLDRILYGPQTTDVSQGRSPDGDAAWAWFNTPTPATTTSRPRNLPLTSIKMEPWMRSTSICCLRRSRPTRIPHASI